MIVAGADEPGLVGEDHGLGAVAQPELEEDAADVGLDRRLAHDQRGGDLGVGSPRAISTSTSRSRAVSSSSPAGGSRVAGPAREALDQPAGDRGASSASPAATARTRRTSRSGGASLSRKPLAPGAQRVVDVLVEVEGGEHQHPARRRRPARAWPRCRRAAACGRPSARRRDAARRAASTASRAVGRLAEHLDVRLGARGSSRSPARTSSWSSATSTDVTRAPSERQLARAPRTAVRPARRSNVAAVDPDPLAHAGQTVARAAGVAATPARQRRCGPRRATAARSRRIATSAGVRACRSTFVSASCTMR